MEEIERKYVVNSDAWRKGLTEADSSLIQQGYLNTDPDRVVRVRIREAKAFLTIKSRPVGISRSEFEYTIPLDDATELLKMCLGKILIKRRYEVKYKGNVWEIDEFFADHEGLIMAEIELRSEDQVFEIPEWIGAEVSGNPKYSNMSLAMNSKEQ